MTNVLQICRGFFFTRALVSQDACNQPLPTFTLSDFCYRSKTLGRTQLSNRGQNHASGRQRLTQFCCFKVLSLPRSRTFTSKIQSRYKLQKVSWVFFLFVTKTPCCAHTSKHKIPHAANPCFCTMKLALAWAQAGDTRGNENVWFFFLQK